MFSPPQWFSGNMKSSSRRSEDDCARAYSSRYLWEFLGGICERGQKIFGEDFLLVVNFVLVWFMILLFLRKRSVVYIEVVGYVGVWESLVFPPSPSFSTIFFDFLDYCCEMIVGLCYQPAPSRKKKTSPTIRDSFWLGLGFKVTWISSPLIPKKVGKAKRVSWKTVWEVNIAPEN